MATKESSASAHPSSREQRGLALARERFEEIERVAPWTWTVPSCTGSGRYLVDIKTETCSCDDSLRRNAPCKHLYAASIVHAKTAACSGCGGRFRRRELIELHEGAHDNLTYFHGDLLCRRCADAAGVEY
jgi:hypothetical protein